MDESKALSILTMLADGIHPATGEVFTPDSPYQSPDVVRALFIAVRALELRLRKPKGALPSNAGKPWSDEEDRKLLAEFDHGRSLVELAKSHARTVAGIQARLERHGRLEASAQPTNGARPWRGTGRPGRAS